MKSHFSPCQNQLAQVDHKQIYSRSKSVRYLGFGGDILKG